MSEVLASTVAAIANGQSLAGAVSLGEKVLCAIVMPAAWTAADITFQVSDDNGDTWHDLLDDGGNEITLVAPAAGKRYQLDPSQFTSAMRIKVRSGKSAAAVAQGAARNVTLVARRYFAMR